MSVGEQLEDRRNPTDPCAACNGDGLSETPDKPAAGLCPGAAACSITTSFPVPSFGYRKSAASKAG